MKKAKLTSLVVLFQAAIAFSGIAYGFESAGRTDQNQIHGTVDFVQRKGFAPGTMDSMTYWSVVVHADGVNYELSHVFGIEKGRPESTMLEGQVIHPGDRVTIDGKAQLVRKNFGLVSDISKVEVE